jgi:hypothetical protein
MFYGATAVELLAGMERRLARAGKSPEEAALPMLVDRAFLSQSTPMKWRVGLWLHETMRFEYVFLGSADDPHSRVGSWRRTGETVTLTFDTGEVWHLRGSLAEDELQAQEPAPFGSFVGRVVEGVRLWRGWREKVRRREKSSKNVAAHGPWEAPIMRALQASRGTSCGDLGMQAELRPGRSANEEFDQAARRRRIGRR